MKNLSRQAVVLAFVAIAAFLVAHTLNAFVAQALLPPLEGTEGVGVRPAAAGHVQDLRQLAREIETSRLFALPPPSMQAVPGTAVTGGRMGQSAGMPALDAVKKIRLLGTVVGDGAQSLAVVEHLTGRRQAAYRLGDQVEGVGMVSDIRKESILLTQGPLQEELFLDILQQAAPAVVPAGAVVAPASAPGSGPLRRSVDRAELSQMLSDVPKLMTQARAIPYMNEGKVDGFRMDFIMKGSFFEKIGLQAGDVLQRINGVELRDPGMALGLFQQLRNERTVAVDVLRNSQRTTLTYDIRG
jgi:general secretion pathway protein C